MSLEILQGTLKKGKITVPEKHKADESWRPKKATELRNDQSLL